VQAKGRKSLHTQTKWFQGHTPKTLSDGLLYFVAPSKPYKRQKVVNGDHSPGKNGLLQDMEDMILPLYRWDAEGYPVPVADDRIPKAQNIASPEECPSTPSFQDLESISLDEAKDIVAASGFRVKGQNELDKQLYLQTLLLEEEGKGSDARVFGLDCEMVLTSMGSELARITLIQMKSFDDDKLETTTILDALVKPENPVKDYLTRHSGITSRLLDPVTTRLQQIQVALRRFLRPSDILVGHSLENDLMAAHFVHPRVIDTSLIFRHGNKRTKFSLRHISASLLKRNIQRGSHCSEEDAVAALELAVRRACIGDSFILPSSDERRSVLERWTTMKEMKVASIGPPAWLQSHFTNTANGIHALGCNSVAECSKAVLAWTKGSRKLHLAWSHMDLGSGSENTLEAFQKMLVSHGVQNYASRFNSVVVLNLFSLLD
jgi:DNA polymerase III epsilon subunit-like protein